MEYSGRVDRANAAFKKLETDNAEIRAEMEESKLSASKSVTACMEVEGNIDKVNVLDEVSEKVRQQAKGLSFVDALLLLVMNTEEHAFWMLVVLLENVLVNDYYTDNLYGCHVEQSVFKDLLVKKKCPRIAAHLEAMGFDVSLVVTEWFLCLFSKCLPSKHSTCDDHFN
ncbi:hypothetical protein IEQ34_017256 [Dendrobium chrysotoxum]|uniref:Rab-GAP TBC domain-containing protein n=1 Tax=Dendrobium chrysotoxum TaxID=161865 RepID=A0AAV7GAV3_DENCH|nr:hypothetical protein IEQ34_017256 [Dendrobium chrysotoxum]